MVSEYKEITYDTYLEARRAARLDPAADVTRDGWNRIGIGMKLSTLSRLDEWAQAYQSVDAQSDPLWGAWG